MGDIIDDLERLARLREAGALTQEEFDAQKARVLNGAADLCAGCGAPLHLDAEGYCAYCHEPASPVQGAVTSRPGSDDATDDAIARANPKKRINAIKILRQQTGLGLREAKDRMDAAYRRIGR